MKDNTIYIGLDVDDKQYHGCALNVITGEVLAFKCRPTLKGLINQLEKLKAAGKGKALKLCYEASYVGFTLQRDLVEKGYHCEIMSIMDHSV